MTEYTIINEEKKQISKVICNMCGEEIKKDVYGYFKDYVHIDKVWGYNSEKDGESISIDICEKCFDKLISDFIIKP